MRPILVSRELDIPEGVRIKTLSRKVNVVGPRGSLSRNFQHVLIQIKIQEKKKKMVLKVWNGKKKKLGQLEYSLFSHYKFDFWCKFWF
mmetsp:Transcript_9298/g.18595  ORF Transcript_9298/g.18595 Transcript_9298/m.18595 type:complete len:88 (-) Transcript_9298:4894-5157(-)